MKNKKTQHKAHLAHLQIEFHVILGAFDLVQFQYRLPITLRQIAKMIRNAWLLLGSEKYLEMAGFHIYLKLLEVLSFRLLVVPLGFPLHR